MEKEKIENSLKARRANKENRINNTNIMVAELTTTT
jgi:hypothetical protein